MKKLLRAPLFLPIIISFLFLIAYVVIGFIRQMHFLSGYDLAVVDQAMWHYSHFQAPISTNHAYAFTSILWDHVEFIYPLLVPFYWIANSVYTLIFLQTFAISTSGIAIYLLAKKYSLNTFTSLSLLISYLMFYGIQNAIWADVHSLVFGVSFLAWFLYFVENKNVRLSWLFFILSIISKEDMALLTLLISGVVFIIRKDKQMLWFIASSAVYLFAIYIVYFPHFVPGGYRFQSKDGLLSNINLSNLYNTSDKRNVLLYSSLWYGLLPFFSPLYVLPALGDLAKYFVIANSVVTSGQSIFGHYRVSLGLLLIWPTIVSIARFKFFQTKYTAIYLLLCTFALQYYLHSPLSYLAKKWFWTTPPSVSSMQQGVQAVPKDASIVTQVNFLPHLSHRKNEFILWPNTKSFTQANSPCGQTSCNWFRWAGSPTYLLVDTSPTWDVRYWLTSRDAFVDGLRNLEKMGYIKPLHTWKSTTLYAVLVKINN